MKKAILYILLVFYIAVQLKPLSVLTGDFIAHSFFKASHMASVHYENGHYHVHKELKAIADEDYGSSGKAAASEKYNELISTTCELGTKFVLDRKATNTAPFILSHQHTLAGHSKISTPPPKTV